VRRLYPKAKFDDDYNSRWLVLLRRYVDEFNFVHLLSRSTAPDTSPR
jgi:hypothetical protein